MHKRLLFSATITAALLTQYSPASAQEEADVLRFSTQSPQGTARSIGFGGALGAIGADFSVLGVNPAGIGVYRSSEFTFTPSIKLNSTSSTYTGPTSDDNSARFTINNLGVVFTSAMEGRRYKNSKWKAASFGFGINRVADFNSSYIYNGKNNTSSAGEIFYTALLADTTLRFEPATLAGMGFSTFITNSYLDTNGIEKYYLVPDYAGGLNQTKSVQQHGGITDFSFSFGGNYEEKLMLGMTVGVPTIRFNRMTTIREEDASGNNDNDFNYFEYTESLKTTGTGINLKIGGIYNFNKNFRGGLALHTPTLYSMTDNYSNTLTSNTEKLKYYVLSDPNPMSYEERSGEYNYAMTTPWKTVLSVAGIFGKHGFISADYEYTDYSSARFYFDDIDITYQNSVNTGIKTLYKGASALRIGGEARFDIIMLRLGMGYYGNPYKNASLGADKISFSGGIGFRFDNIFLDLGYSHTSVVQKESPYTVEYPAYLQQSDPGKYANITVPQASIKNNTGNIALTFGTKF